MPAHRGIVGVRWDPTKLRQGTNEFMRRQVPYAMATALTWTVEDTKEQLIEELPRTFTIRSRWTAQGIRVKPATKQRLGAHVGSIDPYMAEQTVGAIKVGTRASVPIGARSRPQARTSPARWPGALIKKGAFVIPIGGGQSIVFKRLKGRKRTSGKRKRGRLKAMWLLARRVKVEPRWELEGTLRRVAGQRWTSNMRQAWRRARATRRR